MNRYAKKPKRESSSKTLKDSIHGLLKAYKLDGKYQESELVEAWHELMGKTISKRTAKVYVKNDVMFVQIMSASLRAELNANKPKLMKLFEERFRQGVLKDFLFY